MDDRPRFHARNVQTLTMAVQREVERMILSGEVRSGERLSESALAESMGVSRGPVREAMRGLMQAGLVRIIANKGVVVRELGVDEALDLYDLRAAIFALACETLARRRTPEQVAELERNMRDMRSACRADDRDSYYRLNLEFHGKVVEFCGNRRAQESYQGHVKEMHLFRRRGLSITPNIEASLQEHQAIVDALRAGDGEAARRAGRRHVLGGKKRFLKTIGPEGGGAAPERAADAVVD